MDTGESNESRRNDYRRRALEIYRQRAQDCPPDNVNCEEALEELRVHQIEVELQNEDLRRAREEAEAARDTYFLLFDMAPVPYLVVDERGSIRRANLKAAEFLETGRKALRGSIKRFFPGADASVMDGLLDSSTTSARGGRRPPRAAFATRLLLSYNRNTSV